ncbi:sugar phosphate isomerase/epimerase [Muricauda sp. SCSIO 64092]|uniref:sugar phosphate isomerase/epimerase family protein n=1 Tax=Allomuricauda sp. SCSIO 64092 TaxID=2908842 RepID=UPI001FF2C773|nr:sugar phosphate isomerase/epimerase [Muricauda sp. SCSIO 64092]UOY08278.1 sugar phosphate isomerase/epimerase [Muricauda sp. SCSIO 64092]
MNRRNAIKNTLLGAGGLSLLRSFSTMDRLLGPVGNFNVGIQLFTIPGLVDKDLSGTLETLGEIGYREIEFYGPYPFSAEIAQKQWAGMKKMLNLQNDAFFGLSAKETSRVLNRNNLECPSMHTDIITLRTNMDSLLKGVSIFEPKYLVLPAIIDINARKDKEAYLRLAEEFNGFGRKMSGYGMKFVYHNHGYEHANLDGEMGLDILIKNTDPKYVQFELDIFWMKAAGAEPIDYLKKYPERFKMLHLKDASEEFRFSGDGGTPDQWMAGFPKMADPGDGILDIQGIILEGQNSGVNHFFLERDLAPNPMDTLTNSYKNLIAM